MARFSCYDYVQGWQGWGVMDSIEQLVREQVARELYKLLNVEKFGEQIIAERLKDAVLKLSVV
jgi:hypothetical protein